MRLPWEKHVFDYQAEFEKYTDEGEIYKTGRGGFDDNKTYEIIDNKGSRKFKN